MSPSAELKAAVQVARAAYSAMRERDPAQTMSYFFAVVMNVTTEGGWAAAKRKLMNDGYTPAGADQTLSEHVASAKGGVTMLGVTVTLPSVIHLVSATGASNDELRKLGNSLRPLSGHDELRVVVVSETVTVLTLGRPAQSSGRVELDRSKLN